MQDGLYQVSYKGICAGFVVEGGRVTMCAPVLRRRLEYFKTIATYIGGNQVAIEFIKQISEANVQAIREHLDGLKQHLSADVSTYAKGRQRFWLEAEWDLKHRVFRPALHDERLWSYCKKIWPEAELGLAAYGPIGIKMHRDDSYADYTAVTINLGEVEAWRYNQQYQGWGYGPQGPPNITDYQIKPGYVIKFNCKNQHSPINPAPDRWSINLWHVNPKFRKQWDDFKNGGK